MGGTLVDSSAEGVSSGLCPCYSTCDKAGFEHISCACSGDGNFESGITIGQSDLAIEEIGTALTEVMHVFDGLDDEGTDQDEDSDENENSLLSLESDSADDLVDADTEVVTSSTFPTGDASGSSIGKSDGENLLTNCTPTLVSAMKGSRAKWGTATRLSVSWAPDVYDPPVTSDSHTVRTHQRSSRKSHYKYKPAKSSSSSRSSNGSKKDKKHSHHSSSSSNNNRKERKPSHRSSNGGVSSSSRKTDTSASQHRRAYGSSSTSTTNTSVPQYIDVSPWVLPESAPVAEAVPVLKTMEPIKRSTSCCKEQPLNMLSRQFVAAKYKGMFSLWSQNQLAS